MKLVCEFITRSTATGTLWASALNHELRNHPVKSQSIVKISFFFLPRLLVGKFLGSFRQSDKILDRLRRFFFQQTNHNIALRSLKNCVCSCRSAHQFFLPSTYLSYTTPARPRHPRHIEPCHQAQFSPLSFFRRYSYQPFRFRSS